MVFRKYKAVKQWGKMDTRIFKEMLNARNNRKMPVFRIPEAVKAVGAEVHDPNAPGFFTGDVVKNEARTHHPAFRTPGIEEHELYHPLRCNLFDGSQSMSDGMAQACVLTKSVLRESFPEAIVHSHQSIDLSEQAVRDCILHGEKFDPTLEKLPRRFDPVLFWVKHQRVHGTPVVKRNNIILNNLYRSVNLLGLHSGKVIDRMRCDRDEPISALLPVGARFEDSPFVLRFQPHLTIQGDQVPTAWATRDEVEAASTEAVLDISPLSPIIDLCGDNIYNDEAVVARPGMPLSLHTLLWAREQDQKYPWTSEQNAANAILHTFGATVAQATRRSGQVDLLENPVVTKGVQLVDGKLDLVAVQLNTLDLTESNPVKNIVWVEKGLRLYKPTPFYEEPTDAKDINMATVHKLVALLLSR